MPDLLTFIVSKLRIMKLFKKTIAIDIISALFILVFVYTATSKLFEHNSFKAILSESPLIASKANMLSWTLPILELFTAASLLIPSFRKLGFLISFILMLLFTSYVAYMILFAKDLSCSCGGVISQMTWAQHLVFNIFFTALAFASWRFTRRNKLFIAIDRKSRTPV